jgi:rhamnogalacturonyl hydrolase YesR
MKRIIFFIQIFLISGFACQVFSIEPKDTNNDVEKLSRLVINDLLSRDKLMMYKTESLQTIHYAEVCTAFGAIKLAREFKDTSLLHQLEKRYKGVLNHFDTLPANHVDANVIGILPLELYRWNGNKDYLQMGLKMADRQWENPQPDGLSNQTRYWIDDMYMIGILQIEAFNVTNKQFYLERAAMELDAYLKKLQQPNGLFFHGPNAPFCWGRGNGWVAVALAELIAVLPSTNPHYTSILSGYKRMMDALIEHQTLNGMWRQLVDNKDAWEESSATAMFGYSIKLGVNKGILLGEKYKIAYKQAWIALTKHINEQGKLTNICVGTGQSTDVTYYLKRPVTSGDLHGQAPTLWFAFSLISVK